MFEIKSLAEKRDYPDLFTVRFAREKLYIGDTSYPIGQLSVDMLNISKESMLKLKSLSESFAKTIDQKFFSPKEQHSRDMVLEAQGAWNQFMAFAKEFPVIKDLRIPMKEFQDMLPSAYDEIHGKCSPYPARTTYLYISQLSSQRVTKLLKKDRKLNSK